MSICIVNNEDRYIADKLQAYGLEILPTETSYNVSNPISRHADVLYLNTDTAIYVSDCQKNNIEFLKSRGYNIKSVKLKAGYKTECMLNVVVSDNLIVANSKVCNPDILLSANKKFINVNQGYTKCSTVVLSKDNFITEDIGIYKAVKAGEKNCLLIEKGHVQLNGYDYGFIGGAAAVLNNHNTILFFGNIKKHPQYDKIKEFCNNLNYDIDYIENIPLQDIGGVVII